jgi:hypothetical protein
VKECRDDTMTRAIMWKEAHSLRGKMVDAERKQQVEGSWVEGDKQVSRTVTRQEMPWVTSTGHCAGRGPVIAPVYLQSPFVFLLTFILHAEGREWKQPQKSQRSNDHTKNMALQ